MEIRMLAKKMMTTMIGIESIDKSTNTTSSHTFKVA